MNDPQDAQPGELSRPSSAGAMIRAQREQRGVHVAMLAATLKVSPRRIEALERDDFSAMPDINFVRAFAKSVCRQLQMDDQVVLKLLPQAATEDLANVGVGLQQPFRERPGRGFPGVTPVRPLILAVVLVILCSSGLVLLQMQGLGWISGVDTQDKQAFHQSSPTVQPPVAPAARGQASAPWVEIVQAGGVADPVQGDSAALTVTDASWIEILDASQRVLLSRLVQPGESLTMDVRQPLHLKVGNARATQLFLRGKPIDLMAIARENVARVDLH